MTLSSMFSPNKNEDKKLLLLLSETIEVLVNINTPESLKTAESLGELYLQTESKIKNYDYSKDDEMYYWVQV